MSAPPNGGRSKRVREFLTPEAKRTLIALGLMGAGYPTYIAWPVAQAVFDMPTNGIRNQEAAVAAIGEQIIVAQAKRDAFNPEFQPSAAPPRIRLVYSRKTDQ